MQDNRIGRSKFILSVAAAVDKKLNGYVLNLGLET